MKDKGYDELDTMYKNIIYLQAELSELRAWKEKARPFLEEIKTIYQDSLEVPAFNHLIRVKKVNELTELLGGDDEN